MQIACRESRKSISFHSCFSASSNANLITSAISPFFEGRSLVSLSAYLAHSGEKLSKENGKTFMPTWRTRLDRCTDDHEILRDFGKRKFSVRHRYARSELCERRKLSLARGCSHLFRASVKRESC